MSNRIYICHTFYHAYISFLKELALPKEERGHADLMLSVMSNNFGDFSKRVELTGLFDKVIIFDEKEDTFFPELANFKKDKGNIIANLIQRIRYTKKFAKLEAQYIPVNLKAYREVYVFCDSDPIGYYLNQKHIRYHALEDGLNCLVHFDAARFDNRGHFGLKAFMSKKMNLIFVQNGYGKYCADMEVNDIAAIEKPCPYYVELPRKKLVERLTKEDKSLILSAFVKNIKDVTDKLSDMKAGERTLILTDPLCDLETRTRIFLDIAKVFKAKGQIFIKPHPRDLLDYRLVFPDDVVFDGTMPMEMLDYFDNIHFENVVTVYTDLNGISFADKKIRLGHTFMDKYEDPEIHNKNRQAGIKQEEDDKLE